MVTKSDVRHMGKTTHSSGSSDTFALRDVSDTCEASGPSDVLSNDFSDGLSDAGGGSPGGLDVVDVPRTWAASARSTVAPLKDAPLEDAPLEVASCEHAGPVRQFALRFSSTPRGARLARRLAACRLAEWGLPYDGPTNETVTLLVAELTANAVQHGQVPGRDFRLVLTVDLRTVRAEVTDTRGERVPELVPPPSATSASAATASAATGGGLAEGGRGLLLVAALATRWGWQPREDGPGKTVWAECALPGRW